MAPVQVYVYANGIHWLLQPAIPLKLFWTRHLASAVSILNTTFVSWWCGGRGEAVVVVGAGGGGGGGGGVGIALVSVRVNACV